MMASRFGALIVAVLGNGLNLLNVPAFWQSILKGAILVAAIMVNGNVVIRGGGKALAVEKP